MGESDSPLMTSHRPYILRALYEWIADNGMTPHVLVDAGVAGVRVPPHVVKDGRVVLNIAERAVAKLELGDDALRFSARFGGVSQNVVVPVPAVIAVYARETGQGMALPEDPHPTADAPLDEVDVDVGEDAAPSLALVSSDDDAGPGDDGGPETPRPPRRGNHLRVVK